MPRPALVLLALGLGALASPARGQTPVEPTLGRDATGRITLIVKLNYWLGL